MFLIKKFLLYCSELETILNKIDDQGDLVNNIDAVVIDPGVSKLQLSDTKRGFAYQEDAPLDMRMEPDW